MADDSPTNSANPHFAEPVVTSHWDDDDWQLNDDLETAERLVRSHHTPPANRARTRSDTYWRIDGPHHQSAAPNPDLDTSPVSRGTDHFQNGSGLATPTALAVNYAAWTLLAIGLMAFTCGGVLAAWSLATDQTRLWHIGVPLLLAGQAGLLMGLVLQLERLWRNYRRTRDVLGGLENQLNDLQRTTTLLTGTHSGSSQSFYAHMAEGAHPELLLADLKSQLDLLAGKLSR